MKEFLEACRQVVDYMWKDEELDWEICGKPDNHIFIHIKTIQKFLELYEWVEE